MAPWSFICFLFGVELVFSTAGESSFLSSLFRWPVSCRALTSPFSVRDWLGPVGWCFIQEEKMVRREFDNFMVDGEKLTVHIGLMYRLLLPAASSIQLSSTDKQDCPDALLIFLPR